MMLIRIKMLILHTIQTMYQKIIIIWLILIH